jgi:hypothetical protein
MGLLLSGEKQSKGSVRAKQEDEILRCAQDDTKKTYMCRSLAHLSL